MDKQAGFALYLAIGFTVLISVLVGSVGTRLNIAALNEARTNDGHRAREAAQTALSQGWQELNTQFDASLNPLYLAAHSEIFSAETAADQAKCIGAYESNLDGYKKFPRTPSSGDHYRRFFMKREGSTYKIYGCGFDPKSTRVAFAAYQDDGTRLSLTRLRLY